MPVFKILSFRRHRDRGGHFQIFSLEQVFKIVPFSGHPNAVLVWTGSRNATKAFSQKTLCERGLILLFCSVTFCCIFFLKNERVEGDISPNPCQIWKTETIVSAQMPKQYVKINCVPSYSKVNQSVVNLQGLMWRERNLNLLWITVVDILWIFHLLKHSLTVL